MLGQQIITKTGVKTKLDLAIQRLKAFEPPEGYWVAFSGGKDSQCVYHLCQMAGVMVTTWKVLVPWRLRKYNAVCGGCHNCGPVAVTRSGAIKKFMKGGRKKPHGEKRRTLDCVQGSLR